MLGYRWTVIAAMSFDAVLAASLATRSARKFAGLSALVPVLLWMEVGTGVSALGSLHRWFSQPPTYFSRRGSRWLYLADDFQKAAR